MKARSWLRQRWGRVLLLGLAVVLVPYVLSRVTSPWRNVSVHAVPGAATVDQVPTNRLVRIACYNIAHGRGVAASNWEGGDASERFARLDRIVELLKEIDADVVVLNEVDFRCSWSGSVDQARYLSEKAGYGHLAKQSNLDFRVLGWKWRFGNAVLSRFLIEQATLVDFPGYSAFETVAVGKKRGLVCDIRVRGQTLRVVGAHLCHRSESVRARSAEVIHRLAAGSAIPTILAGDLNSAPEGFPVFETSPDGNAIAALEKGDVFQRSPSHPPPASGWTYHSQAPSRVIDWIMIPPRWSFSRYEVVHSDLSDHRLVYADIVLPAEGE